MYPVKCQARWLTTTCHVDESSAHQQQCVPSVWGLPCLSQHTHSNMQSAQPTICARLQHLPADSQPFTAQTQSTAACWSAAHLLQCWLHFFPELCRCQLQSVGEALQPIRQPCHHAECLVLGGGCVTPQLFNLQGTRPQQPQIGRDTMQMASLSTTSIAQAALAMHP